MATSVDLEYPFAARWLVQNSPANRVPSHGTSMFATSYAIDFVPVTDTGRSAPLRFESFIRPEPPTRFPGFGRPILSPIEGVVLAAQDNDADHSAYRGVPSIVYALSQRQRAAAGWRGIAGNHVFIENNGVVVALCHLQQASIEVRLGQHVQIGQVIARCGNSGNSTEPHLHVQALNSSRVEDARAVPLTFRGSLPRNGEIVNASE